MSLQPVRGTHDLMGEELRRHLHVITTARAISERYGYGEIVTPIFEFSEVFHRTLGETSDVVSKETYTFTDRGGDSITLRPEFTAGVARAFLSHNLQDQLPCKFFYAGPAFRYERPQKGRMRQFHQIGAELLGASEVQADIEVIALGWHMLDALGLSAHVKLELNSLGDNESRAAYRTALVDYFRAYAPSLSEDSKIRLEKNPLRILDSKDEGDRKIIAGAPSMQSCFTPQSLEFAEGLQEGLRALGIGFTVQPHLVRGLDYYCHTVFEFTTDRLGAQNTVLAGGRYDQLIAQMGGKETPGIGFAAGVERLAALMEAVGAGVGTEGPKPIALIPLGEQAEKAAIRIAFQLRGEGFVVEQSYRGNMSNRMKKANRAGAVAAVILGDNELERGVATIRNLGSGEQEEVALDAIATALSRFAPQKKD